MSDKHGWIRVKDELPTVSKNYLVTGIFPNGYLVAYWDWNSTLWRNPESYMELGDVTHWMPLPDDPEVDDG